MKHLYYLNLFMQLNSVFFEPNQDTTEIQGDKRLEITFGHDGEETVRAIVHDKKAPLREVGDIWVMRISEAVAKEIQALVAAVVEATAPEQRNNRELPHIIDKALTADSRLSRQIKQHG